MWAKVGRLQPSILSRAIDETAREFSSELSDEYSGTKVTIPNNAQYALTYAMLRVQVLGRRSTLADHGRGRKGVLQFLCIYAFSIYTAIEKHV